MSGRQRKWLILSVVLATVLVFALFKAVPVGLRMYAYSQLDEATLAVPVVAVQCEDRRGSMEGTLIDLGYAEFRLSGEIELIKVARHETTGEAWAVLLKGDGFVLAVLRARTYEPYAIAVESTTHTMDAPAGWSRWAAPSASSNQFRSEYLSLPIRRAGEHLDQSQTFEFNMLCWHVRPLTVSELAAMSSDQFTRYMAVALGKYQYNNAGTQTLLLSRNGAKALAPHYGGLWDLRVWPDNTLFYQGFAVRNVAHDADAERVCREIVSTYRIKVDPDANQNELWEMFHAACEGK